jgi:hypothetical protein
MAATALYRSKQKAQAELNVARRSDRSRDHTRAWAADRLARQVELRVIQNVEEFASQL